MIDYIATFPQLYGDTTIAVSSLVLGIDGVYFLPFAGVFVLLVQPLQDVVVGTSGDIRELQKTFKGIFMP